MKKYLFSFNFFLLFYALLSSEIAFAQLGFCSGNSGDPIFTETFGAGTNYGPALPTGTTNYTFVGSNGPQDGQYTVGPNTFVNGWSLPSDHTPNDSNGKALIVNASFTAGEFYSSTVNGLCENTTYEFSSWLINILPNSGCGGNGIPVNVQFEIWDITNTSLLASGNTGDIFSTTTPTWQQYALVFQTLPGETAVILKMKNNGVGGCGNDLAIDDIVFKSCGDFISISDQVNNSSITICSTNTPFSQTLTVTPDNSVFNSHFYQWEESTDGINWIDIPGENSQTISMNSILTSHYYRAKVAESAANLNNPLCNVTSDVFLVDVNILPSSPSTACWETATINDATCSWEITGTQPTQPTLECWETATFNNTTCSWDIIGAQPMQPTGLECWETVTFNNTSCVWEISGTQPTQPTLECWETASFNNTSCVWEVTGTQQAQPTGLECWETATFNNNFCVWEVTGTQQAQPTGLECWETATFNNNFCVWEVTGTQQTQPTLECWETASFNDTSCLWEVTGTQQTQPTLECWETATFNNTSCVWEVTGEQPIIESISSEGNSIVVITSNTGDFLYSLDGIIFQSNNTFYNVEGGLYTIYVKANNCNNTITNTYLHFYIPQFFTPNNDGKNDTFDLKGIENYSSSEVYIYDRFGKVLKTTKNSAFSWNGIYNNNPLPASDYWYVLIIEGQRYVGHFTLKR